MNNELWVSVVGYEGLYEVSNRGRVRGVNRVISHQKTGSRTIKGQIIAQRIGRGGYFVVDLYSNQQQRRRKVHQLVLEAFVGPRPENFVACHANDVPTDNRLENLRWDSISANTCDSIANGSHFQARKTSCRRGHPYTTNNTYIRPNGGRGCRTCRRQAAAKHRMAKI